jgi:hypothetical protein
MYSRHSRLGVRVKENSPTRSHNPQEDAVCAVHVVRSWEAALPVLFWLGSLDFLAFGIIVFYKQ